MNGMGEGDSAQRKAPACAATLIENGGQSAGSTSVQEGSSTIRTSGNSCFCRKTSESLRGWRPTDAGGRFAF